MKHDFQSQRKAKVEAILHARFSRIFNIARHEPSYSCLGFESRMRVSADHPPRTAPEARPVVEQMIDAFNFEPGTLD